MVKSSKNNKRESKPGKNHRKTTHRKSESIKKRYTFLL